MTVDLGVEQDFQALTKWLDCLLLCTASLRLLVGFLLAVSKRLTCQTSRSIHAAVNQLDMTVLL